MALQATTIKQCEDALRASGGFVSTAAKMLHISQGALSKRMSQHPELRAVYEEIIEGYLDIAESVLMRKVSEGDLGALCFFLKCKGKKRGYIERQEVATSGTTTNINVSGDELTDKQLDKIIARG